MFSPLSVKMKIVKCMTNLSNVISILKSCKIKHAIQDNEFKMLTQNSYIYSFIVASKLQKS